MSTAQVAVRTPSTPARQAIKDLEGAIKELPQTDCPLAHMFARGLYSRTILIKAGTVLTGAVHKYSHFSVVTAGEVTVVTEEGRRLIKAPWMEVSPAGVKRAMYAHQDTLWTTFHHTQAKTPEEAEADLVVADFDLLPESLPQ